MKVTINATKARQNFFGLLLAAKNKKQITRITLGGEVVAEIRPKVGEKFDWDKYEKEVAEGIKYLRKFDWSDVLRVRKRSKVRRYGGW